MLGVINYGTGNYRSLCNALEYLSVPFKEILMEEDFEGVSHIVLPGVGAFNDCIARLKTQKMFDRLKSELLEENKLFLGVCVGHQVLASLGTEFEEKEGLDLISGKVIKLDSSKSLPVPHTGWTEVNQLKNSALFNGIGDKATFYFVHSFHFRVKNEQDILATASYGKEITVAVKKGNIYGVQFHPEKSQKNGLKLLKNFSELVNKNEI